MSHVFYVSNEQQDFIAMLARPNNIQYVNIWKLTIELVSNEAILYRQIVRFNIILFYCKQTTYWAQVIRAL